MAFVAGENTQMEHIKNIITCYNRLFSTITGECLLHLHSFIDITNISEITSKVRGS